MNKLRHPDLSFAIIIILAALAIPRVFLHDLHIVSSNSLVYTTLAVAPLLIWLVVAIGHRSKTPFYDFLLVSLAFGLMLALAHQLNWAASFEGFPPHIGGNLAGKFSPGTEEFILRTAAFISSTLTGLVFGTAFGLVAIVANKLRSPR